MVVAIHFYYDCIIDNIIFIYKLGGLVNLAPQYPGASRTLAYCGGRIMTHLARHLSTYHVTSGICTRHVHLLI